MKIETRISTLDIPVSGWVAERRAVDCLTLDRHAGAEVSGHART